MKARTSLTIDQNVLDLAKQLARREGRTLSGYVSNAVDMINNERKLLYDKKDREPVKQRRGTQVPLITRKLKRPRQEREVRTENFAK